MEFQKDFIWGAASSAYQIEGYSQLDGGGACIWDTFCRRPGAIADGGDGSVACDAYHRFQEDLDILFQLNIRHYRFSTSWARVDPMGDGNWNAGGLRYYDRLVDACLDRGITPWVTLYHWELPQAIEDQGGWLRLETAQAFGRFASMMAKHFQGRVHHYFTLNEPQIVLSLGHALGLHAPGRQYDPPQLVQCWKHLMLAHGLAARAIREADSTAQVGLASTGRLCWPHSPEDREASTNTAFAMPDEDWMFTHPCGLDAACFGHVDPEGPRLAERMSDITPQEWEIMHAVPDMIGVNSYNGHEIAAGPDGKPVYLPRYPGFPRTALKWPITPEIMEYGYEDLYRRYGLPLYVTECGLSCNDHIFLDGKVHDPDRIDFLTRYLEALRRGTERADIRGFFHWSLTDNFEWHSGYGERFGLVYVDYPTQRRILKDSAFWYARIAAGDR